MLYAANEEYEMNLSKETLKTMAAFGGGMAVESVCGALTGSLAVISIMFTKERAHESDRIKNLTKEFFDSFNTSLTTDNCAKLKAKYRNDEIRCQSIVETAGELLEKIILREKAKGGL